jgi:hypothetical protein
MLQIACYHSPDAKNIMTLDSPQKLPETLHKKDGSTGQTQIFKAIDQNKRGAPGYIFTFHPDAKEIAQEYIAGLYLFLQTGLTEEELTKYFIPDEIRGGKNLR